jgi:uncharacterized repeat protein (TIGR03803 family)
MRCKKLFSAIKPTFVIFTLAFLLAFALVPAQGQKFKVLHTFHSGKGPQSPSGRLVLDAEGNVYGVAQGGTGICFSNTPCGTVYKVTNAGQLVWVYSFKGPGADGNEPDAGLLRDAKGNLFGVTLYGGVDTKICSDNFTRICGVVFKLDPSGKNETVLHRFKGGMDGMIPEALLAEDSSGNLYGTTIWGGSRYNDGVIFKVNQAGQYKVLFRFWGGGGDRPGLIQGAPGYLYGVDGSGRNYSGGLFEVDLATGKRSVLYQFGPGFDSVLLKDAAGNIYGTTARGGPLYSGIVGELTYSNGRWSYTVLYTFCSQNNCTDGELPSGGLVQDAAGNLYGTTVRGGSHVGTCGYDGCGVVFKLDTSGKETVLHSFTGGADGLAPDGGLVMDALGNIYGTAGYGGDLNCEPTYGGCGVVFKITP